MNLELWSIILIIISVYALIEITLYFWISFVRKHFQWLITSSDEAPELSKEGLLKFIPLGYDPELGWIRKPNSSHEEKGKFSSIKWTINQKGARTNRGFEDFKATISCYGDSFTFCRQVNDNETWEHYLSKLQNTNVPNFGVGNYGIDQSLLRIKREFPKNRTKIVILAVVPDTISRIMSYWRHYYEYGNTFAFKPKFVLSGNNLKLQKNIIDHESKFNSYHKHLPEIKKLDFFYAQKFRKEKLHFPYAITIFKNFKRNFSIIYWVTKIQFMKKFHQGISEIEWYPMRIIMRINLKWRVKLYKNECVVALLFAILKEFASYSKEQNFNPIFLFLPQKDDILFIKKNYHFYEDFLQHLENIDRLTFIDITKHFLKISNLDELYSDDNEYGGHLTNKGNQAVASIIHDALKHSNG